MESLRTAYLACAKIIGQDRIEPFEAALEVERVRYMWKPENVRLIVLAESHVWTSLDDLNLTVNMSGENKPLYGRFVYCLGYGENDILSERPTTKNSGTPQYWRLFHDLVYGPDHKHDHILKTGCKNGPNRPFERQTNTV